MSPVNFVEQQFLGAVRLARWSLTAPLLMVSLRNTHLMGDWIGSGHLAPKTRAYLPRAELALTLMGTYILQGFLQEK
jgi:hypothetical protein